MQPHTNKMGMMGREQGYGGQMNPPAYGPYGGQMRRPWGDGPSQDGGGMMGLMNAMQHRPNKMGRIPYRQVNAGTVKPPWEQDGQGATAMIPGPQQTYQNQNQGYGWGY